MRAAGRAPQPTPPASLRGAIFPPPSDVPLENFVAGGFAVGSFPSSSGRGGLIRGGVQARVLFLDRRPDGDFIAWSKGGPATAAADQQGGRGAGEDSALPVGDVVTGMATQVPV